MKVLRLTRRSLLATTLLTGGAALLSACGTSGMSGLNQGPTAVATGMPGMGGGEYDQRFIDSMVPHHQAAIDMAKVAQEKGEHPEIKQLANDIAASQGKEIDQMKAWRKAWYGSDTIAAGMGGQMAGMDTDLKQLAAASPFDKAFIDAMLPHHQSAIAMATEAQAQAMHAEIKQLAKDIVTAQQREIDQMKAWRAQWYPGQ